MEKEKIERIENGLLDKNSIFMNLYEQAKTIQESICLARRNLSEIVNVSISETEIVIKTLDDKKLSDKQ